MSRRILRGSVWRHDKTGNKYRIEDPNIHLKNDRTTGWVRAVAYTLITKDTTPLCVRPYDYFHERFTFIEKGPFYEQRLVSAKSTPTGR